jgi:hypothetical protein
MIINDQDKEWLKENYPNLSVGQKEISGSVDFDATYNAQSGIFLILKKDITDTVGGLRLFGNFTIHIEERIDKSLSQLPALHVENIETVMDRHFNQKDSLACLCGPFQEDEYLKPTFNFPRFFDELVIPFLYGQLFYSLQKKWPWPDLAHGATGLLESYTKADDPSKGQECLQKLSIQNDWAKIKRLLTQNNSIEINTPCLCPKGGKIRICHPSALKALQQLRIDARLGKIIVP